MSAICGVFNLDKRPVSIEIGSNMMNKLNTYKMDTCGIWSGEHVFFGCGMQFITPESINEKLPFYDVDADLAITADAIIDNREELFNLLDIPFAYRQELSDSQLILTAYKKWGEESPRYLAGDFAFAIWNKRKQELFCARDHVGKRTFYFFYSNNAFVFCTMIKPISDTFIKDMELNEEWIADFLSIEGVLHEIDCNKTIYKDIMQLPPAHTIKINVNGIKKTRYWQPLDAPKVRFKSDFEYEEAFRNVFSEAVKCRLRSTGDIGVMLSGGLDSGAVASVAATQLQGEGKRLKAFSSVPCPNYRDRLPKRLMADESRYIETYKQCFSNIDITYCRAEGKSAVTDVGRYLKMLEQPYKVFQNLYWVDDIVDTAAKNGCKVILDGQFGNFTISYGDFFTNAFSLLNRFKWITLLKEIHGYSKLRGIHPMFVIEFISRQIVKAKFPFPIKPKSKTGDINQRIPVNPDLAAKWNTKVRLQGAGFNINSIENRSLEEVRKFIANNILFSQLGPLDTKMSLEKALVKRDPTRDKRVIEFCMGLPGEQFVRNGHERYLIRRAMAGILPDPVRMNTTVRGKQSADWLQRLSPMWKDIRSDLGAILENKRIEPYFDTYKLKGILAGLGDCIDEDIWGMEVRTLLISYIFYHFLQSMGNRT